MSLTSAAAKRFKSALMLAARLGAGAGLAAAAEASLLKVLEFVLAIEKT